MTIELTPRQQQLLSLLSIPVHPRPPHIVRGKPMPQAPRTVYRVGNMGRWFLDNVDDLPEHEPFHRDDVMALAKAGYLEPTYYGCNEMFNLKGASPFTKEAVSR